MLRIVHIKIVAVPFFRAWVVVKNHPSFTNLHNIQTGHL